MSYSRSVNPELSDANRRRFETKCIGILSRSVKGEMHKDDDYNDVSESDDDNEKIKDPVGDVGEE